MMIVGKLALGTQIFDSNKLSYVLYPIKNGDNDLLIRELPEKDFFDFKGVRWTAHSGANPIYKHPIQYAQSLVKKDILEAIKKKYLKLIDEPLASECLFQYIDRFYPNYENAGKVKYRLADLINRVKIFYPILFEEYCNHKKIANKNAIFDIDTFYQIMDDQDVNQFFKKALYRYKNQRQSNLQLTFANEFFSDSNYVSSSIDFFIDNGIEYIERPYPSYDTGISLDEYYSWEILTPESFAKKIEKIYYYLPELFGAYMQAIFPELVSKINFLDEFDTVIINIHYPTNENERHYGPSIETIYLKSWSGLKYNVNTYFDGKNSPLNFFESIKLLKKDIRINDENYKVVSCKSSISDSFFSRYPIQDLLFEKLHERLSTYFESIMSS